MNPEVLQTLIIAVAILLIVGITLWLKGEVILEWGKKKLRATSAARKPRQDVSATTESSVEDIEMSADTTCDGEQIISAKGGSEIKRVKQEMRRMKGNPS